VSKLTPASLQLADRTSGFIVTNLTESGWRWGFGTFAILMPSVVVPALLILFHADRLAKKQGLITLSASSYVARTGQSQKSWLVLLKEVLVRRQPAR
jgi:hypothetical protein